MLNSEDPEKVLVLKENGNVVFTKPYTKHTFAFEEEIPARDDWHRTKLHTGLLGEIRLVDLRLEDGNFVRQVPIDNFLA